MGVKIRNIFIENFRSIRRFSASTSDIAVFVGKNDCGKSNVFRALNLFFNGTTNPNIPYSFENDYNVFVPPKAQKAREITIRLELEPPDSYKATNGEIIVWEKRWRATGQHSSRYQGCRISENRRGREIREYFDIPEKSNAHTLLRQIDFEYVPAIKDHFYFNELRGRIYNIISSVAAKTFKVSSVAFETSIGEHLADLITDINKNLGSETRLALPRDLSHIFERLDFLNGDKEISLDNRGDGIKARHIPLILKFMAEKKSSLQGRGVIPYSNIWAYEEPENNLEFASAIQLANEFADLAKGGSVQVLLTTHSPVFYDIKNDFAELVTNLHVFRNSIDSGTEASPDASDVDDKIGTMQLLAPRIRKTVQTVKAQMEAEHQAEQLALQKRPRIFCEGESDKIVLERCAAVFEPARSQLVDFVTKTPGGGHNYVIDMLHAWRQQHKHNNELPKAAGILDLDAVRQKNEWNAGLNNTVSAKCFCYGKPSHAVAALDAGFKLPVTLEVTYSRAFWDEAEELGYLEDRSPAEIYPIDKINEIMRGDSVLTPLDPAFDIFIKKKFGKYHKIAAAKTMTKKPDVYIEKQMSVFKGLIASVFDYLGLAATKRL